MSQSRRSFLMSTAAPLLAAPSVAGGPRPNIVVLLADDLASWMLGCYGNQEIRTPNIDRIAAAGVRFANSFVTTPICSASRATLLTGRTPRQHGIHDFLTPKPESNPEQGQAAPPASFASEVMISDVLAQAGYRCGYSGKWHLGNDTKPGHALSYSYTLDGGSSPYQDPVMYLNGNRQQEKGYIAELITNRACEFIDQQSKDTPFFLTVGYTNPHTPYDGHPQRYYDLYRNTNFDSFGIQPAAANALREKEFLAHPVENLRKCAASVTALDDQIAAVQRKLLAKGVWENTIVIFSGDNGFLLGRHGLWSKGHASNPINLYDEVMAVPMLWQWPGRIPVASVRPELISYYDFLPTVCEAAGAKPPAGRNLCGRSYLTPALSRPLPKKEPWRNLVFGHFRYAEMARDNYYKLVLRNGGEGPNELFDLRKDPRERVNQYDSPGFVTVRDGMTAAIAEWRQRYA